MVLIHKMKDHKMTKVNKVEETNTNTSTTYNVNELLTTLKSKSGVIRFLHSQSIPTKTIHKMLTEAKWMNNSNTHPIRYQHIRNVIVTPIKKTI